MSLAPAVTRDGFAYAGDLFVEASGSNRHRRATVAELKEHFKSGSDKDHPAHWFEAQLIHYGLQPSKTKAVARMRLFDAVNGGKLSIPSHIKTLETELKKEWTKKEREAKKALKDTAASPATKSTKRKAESSTVDLTLEVGGINITVSANTSAKKAKATAKPAPKTPKKPEPKPKTPKAKAEPKPKPQKKATPAVPSSSASTSATPRKQTARRGGIHQGPGRGSTPAASTSPQPPRRIQTARRARSWVHNGRGPGPVRNLTRGYLNPEDDSDADLPPPPYTEYPEDDYDSDDDDDGDDDDDVGGGVVELRSLGLLNGRYDIDCPYVTAEWGLTAFKLILTLSGSQLWGRFNLGVVRGVLRFDERPWQSSYEKIEFKWRGREREGPMIYGNKNTGWIKFLGDGRIEGELDYMRIQFKGNRADGQGTRSGVDAAAMRNEWDGYNEREYEEESRSRW
ncbi:hypothetical protein F5Y13DRAFT_151002 [Hypoxylon sp. FL1857]|nr:hypothetical protein F5Y13DRAFT_151002 [Hypoxylon sp. FL1857]